ncbi:hypothetical protein IAC76_08580 [Spirochaetes bacterium]|uniref:Uncharacterized protein n=1 Tax=Candidatus Scatousia excrementipullorum TaxID=2840936 RepID=A0A9D9DQF6_9BACT|nr:hypothetical protein [Candidatus Scatousia excrementipullorum]
MKKFLCLLCLLTFTLPVFSSENSETVKYVNQSESFSGFSKKLPTDGTYKLLEKPTKVTKEETEHDDFLDEFDDDGFRKEKPVSTEKKVIKTMKDNKGKQPIQRAADNDVRPMTYDNFPKSMDEVNSQMLMPMGIPGMF